MPVTKYMIKHTAAGETGKVIHFSGPLAGDTTLCGCDLSGDSVLGWEAGIETTKKVNCPQCIALVKYVLKNITKKDVS